MFFEFAPTGNDNPVLDQVIPAWEAAVGQRYDILVTTPNGLCRCRLGETIKVHAMFGKMPVVSVEPKPGVAALASLVAFRESFVADG